MKDRNEASVENTTAAELQLARSLMIEAERRAGRAERISMLTLTATMVAAITTIVAYHGLGPDNPAGLALPCTHYSFWTIPARSLWAMR